MTRKPPEPKRSLLGAAKPGATTFTLLAWPAHPRRTADALARLAESNPTPERYERERARILEGSQRE